MLERNFVIFQVIEGDFVAREQEKLEYGTEAHNQIVTEKLLPPHRDLPNQ